MVQGFGGKKCFLIVTLFRSWREAALRCFLGGHKCAAKAVVEGDAGWDPCVPQLRCETVRLWNHLVSLPEERLTRKKKITGSEQIITPGLKRLQWFCQPLTSVFNAVYLLQTKTVYKMWRSNETGFLEEAAGEKWCSVWGVCMLLNLLFSLV